MRARTVVGARVAGRRDGPLLVVSFVGLVTPSALIAGRWHILEAMTPGVEAVVVDFRRAALLVTHVDLAAIARQPGTELTRDPAPMAWVTPDEITARMWREHALDLGLSGLRRWASCDAQECERWARQQARLTSVDRQWPPGARTEPSG